MEQEFSTCQTQDLGIVKNEFKVLQSSQVLSDFETEFPKEGNIVEVVEGPKRFSRVFIDEAGYAYHLNKKKKEGTILLRCHIVGCTGSGIFNPENTNFRRLASHFHNPSQNDVQKLRFLHKVKYRAENETTNLSTIYSEEANEFAGVPLPSYEKLKSTLRKRRMASLLPQAATTGGTPTSITSNEMVEKEMATHYIARKGMEVIEGPKRFSKIYIDEHSYCYLVNRKKSDGSLILRCHEQGCRGSGRYDPSDSVFHKLAKHSHYADPLLVTTWRFLHQCKKRAESETTPIKTIYEQESLRHTNCNLPSFKKIESTLQKRRKSNRPKEGLNASDKVLEGPMEMGIANSPCLAETRELEIQLEEVYHPEENPHYFLSPNITYKPPVATQPQENISPMPIIVKTGKVQRSKFPLGKTHPIPNLLRDTLLQAEVNPGKSQGVGKQLKTVRKKVRKKKSESGKLRKYLKTRKVKAFEPRRPSEYKSKMDVMEGTKRFSKIFIDESHHIYQLNKQRLDGVLILKCYETGCHGSGAYFPAEEIFQRSIEHCHEPSLDLVAKCRLLSNLKARAESESGPLRAIYEEEVAKYPDIEIASFRQMESTLQKRRRAKVPSEPNSLREAALQLERTDFSKCSRGNFFRRYLDVEGGEILVFLSPGPLEKAFKEGKVFHLDGSLRVVPQGFAQVVMMHLVMAEHAFPVVYALMSTKSSSSYVSFFKYLKEEFLGSSPQVVSSDFDGELELAFQSVFPKSVVTGCWFYYTQAIWRQLRTCGLAQVFFQDTEAKTILKCAMALPLLPSVRITEGFAFLQSTVMKSTFHLKETKKSLFKILDFINENWILRVGVDRLSVFGMDKRLNHDIEALYQFFIKKLGVESPTLIKFVEKVFQVECIILSDFERKLSSEPIRSDRSRRCNTNEKLLKEICDKFEAGVLSVKDFLQAASSTVPQHCHHDNVIDGEEDDGILQDPSDIPGSLRFCEIRVLAPSETSENEHPSGAAGVPDELGALLQASRNDDTTILIQEIKGVGTVTLSTPGTCIPSEISVVQPDPQACTVSSESQPMCHDCPSEKKDFVTLENVWPPVTPTMPTSQAHNFILSSSLATHIDLPHHTNQGNSYHNHAVQPQPQVGPLDPFAHSLTNEHHYPHDQEPVHHQTISESANLEIEENENFAKFVW